jgi:hypothetical protein
MEQKYLVTFHNEPVDSKPPKSKIGYISNRLTTQTGWTMNEILTYTTKPYSYTWCPSVYDGYRSNSNWKGQRIFVLDFDSGVTPEDIINRFKVFDITPNIMYYSFSDTPQLRKFRLILILDRMLLDSEQAAFIRENLVEIFPESDQKCKDAARMYFGGTHGEVVNDAIIPLEYLVHFISINSITKDKNQTRKIAEKKVILYNIYKDTPISAKSYDINIDDTTSPTGLPENISTNTYLENVKKNDFDYNKAKQKVRIFKEFIDGKRLTHNELFGLATSLAWTKGGLKLMKDTMVRYNENGTTDYTQHNLNILPYVRLMGYKPQWLVKYSPYPEDHEYSNLISAVREPRGIIEIIEPKQKLERSDAEKIMRETAEKVFKEQNNRIIIIKSSTGLGKTELLTEFTGGTLAFPTHELIDELKSRIKVNYTSTPQLPTFFEKSLNERIGYMYKAGLNKEVYKLIKSISSDKYGYLYQINDVKLANEYITSNNKALASTSTVLTTHVRALYNDFKHKTIIFDEDPLDSLIEIKKLDTKDLFAVNSGQNKQDATAEALQYIQKQTPGIISKTPRFAVNIDLLIKSILWADASSNVIQFFSSDYFVRDTRFNHLVHYVTHRKLPDNKKVIIMSATAPVEIYKQLYGERVEVVDIANVKNQGYIEQFTTKSYSRTSLSKNDLTKLKEQFNGKPVITFNTLSDKVNGEAMHIHFGNCDGLDKLKGQDIVVLGTPHLNNIVYHLYATVMGIDLQQIDLEMKYQKIDWKGFRFMFMAYNNEELRKIQLSLIESELIQAVGRARTLRTDAKVEVYSNLPLLVSDKFVF